MAKATFDANLEAFVKAQSANMALALTCSTQAIEHFAEHGQVAYIQRFFDAMDKNFSRRLAFSRWIVAFAPVKHFGKTDTKPAHWASDPDRKGEPVNLKGAAEKPFWEFAPAKEIGEFSADNLKVSLLRVINDFSNADRKRPKDTVALAKLNEAKQAIGAIFGVPIDPSTLTAPAVDEHGTDLPEAAIDEEPAEGRNNPPGPVPVLRKRKAVKKAA